MSITFSFVKIENGSRQIDEKYKHYSGIRN